MCFLLLLSDVSPALLLLLLTCPVWQPGQSLPISEKSSVSDSCVLQARNLLESITRTLEQVGNTKSVCVLLSSVWLFKFMLFNWSDSGSRNPDWPVQRIQLHGAERGAGCGDRHAISVCPQGKLSLFVLCVYIDRKGNHVVNILVVHTSNVFVNVKNNVNVKQDQSSSSTASRFYDQIHWKMGLFLTCS